MTYKYMDAHGSLLLLINMWKGPGW